MTNLINNYVKFSNMPNASQQEKKTGRSYFGSTIRNFDQSTDKLIKPLDGKGHLVNSNPIYLPKEIARDTVYTTKAFADGVRGKANDHQLGKLNDLGLKLSGVAIASYLMTKKSTPKTKAMEFVGFGSFLLSMAVWPKVALEIPARLIHGFNFRKQYVDEQGRKKYVSQDPNYIPFDLYKGDKKSEDLDVIGDRAGIRRDIPNRKEAVKEHMRKVSVQNNTMWMMTAGIATPIMTALACNQAEKYITPLAENYSNKKVNNQIDKLHDYLSGKMTAQEKEKFQKEIFADANVEAANKSFNNAVDSITGKVITKTELANLSDTLANGFDAEMKDAAKADIADLIGGEKYIANSQSAKKMANSINAEILAKDAQLAEKLSPAKLEQAISQGIIGGAVRDLLTSVGTDVIDALGKFQNVSTNFKCKDVEGIDFFAESAATKNMTPAERLAYNIKAVVMKVNNSNPSQDFVPGMSELEVNDKQLKAKIDAKISETADAIAKNFYEGNLTISEGRENYVTKSVNKLYKATAPRGPKYDKLFSTVGNVVANETKSNKGYVVNEKVADTLKQVGKQLTKYNAVDEALSASAHFKTEKASETIVANNWAKVTDTIIKQLGITDKELSIAGRDKEYSNKLFTQKLEAICSDDKSYKNFITELGKSMVELDEKLDAPNAGKNGRMMSKLESGIAKNCTEAGNALGSLGMNNMKTKMVATADAETGIHIGSIMNSKIERLHSRVEGVHSSYMRLLETAEFFHRSGKYQEKVKSNGGIVTKEIAKEFGFTENHEMNTKIIETGKQILLDAHTNKFYTKMGLHNNKDFFKSLMWATYRPNHGAQWDKGWNASTEETINILDGIKSSNDSALNPRRVFESAERRPLGQKFREHMNQVYNGLGSIKREVVNGETIRVEGGLNKADSRANKLFDLLGKAPSELFNDAIKQKYNSNKWMKVFAPILGVTFGATVIAQFFFGKKDADIKA